MLFLRITKQLRSHWTQVCRRPLWPRALFRLRHSIREVAFRAHVGCDGLDVGDAVAYEILCRHRRDLRAIDDDLNVLALRQIDVRGLEAVRRLVAAALLLYEALAPCRALDPDMIPRERRRAALRSGRATSCEERPSATRPPSADLAEPSSPRRPSICAPQHGGQPSTSRPMRRSSYAIGGARCSSSASRRCSSTSSAPRLRTGWRWCASRHGRFSHRGRRQVLTRAGTARRTSRAVAYWRSSSYCMRNWQPAPLL